MQKLTITDCFFLYESHFQIRGQNNFRIKPRKKFCPLSSNDSVDLHNSLLLAALTTHVR